METTFVVDVIDSKVHERKFKDCQYHWFLLKFYETFIFVKNSEKQFSKWYSSETVNVTKL